MKLIIDIPNEDFEFIKNGSIIPIKYDNHIYEAIRSGTPYEERPQLSDEQLDKIADLLETEWGYEGIREDVARIMREADNE